MANEIAIEHSATGATVYVTVLNSAQQRWNASTSAFENYNSANWTTTKYCIATIEQGATGRYIASFPSGIVSAGRYSITAYAQAGGSPATTDTKLGSLDYDWTGSLEVVPTGDAFGRIGVAGAGLTGITGAALSAAGLDAVLIDGIPLPKAMQVTSAVICGKITTAGQAQEIFVGLDGATTRATITVDASGNRTATTYNQA